MLAPKTQCELGVLSVFCFEWWLCHVAWWLGHVIGQLCHVIGWLVSLILSTDDVIAVTSRQARSRTYPEYLAIRFL